MFIISCERTLISHGFCGVIFYGNVEVKEKHFCIACSFRVSSFRSVESRGMLPGRMKKKKGKNDSSFTKSAFLVDLYIGVKYNFLQFLNKIIMQ